RHFSFVDVADDALRPMSFDQVFNEFVILEDGYLGFLGGGGNDQFFLHLNSCGRELSAHRDTSRHFARRQWSLVVMENSCARRSRNPLNSHSRDSATGKFLQQIL